MGLLPSYSRAELDGYLSSLKPGDLVTRNGVKSSVPSLAGASRTDITALFSHLAQTGIIDQTPSGNVYKGGIEKPMPPATPVNRAYPVSPAERPATAYVHPLAAAPASRTYTAADASAQPIEAQGTGHPASIIELLRETPPPAPRASSISVTPRDPLYAKAYEFWDPSSDPTIFRGAVEDNYGYGRVRVRVLTPGGVKEGIVITHRYEDRKLYEIADGMKGGFVLVRRAQPDEADAPDGRMPLKPLVNIKPEDNATHNDVRIATVAETAAEGYRISNLPVVGQSMKLGVADGLGYMEAGVNAWGKVLHPVFVEGAGDKVWQVLPEVAAHRFSKENRHRQEQAFYIGGVPMTAAEKTRIGLARVDYCIEDKNTLLGAFNFKEASEGGSSADYSERNVPGAEKLFIRALGLFRSAREAGMMQDVGQRVDAIKGIMAQIAAIKGLSERENAIIHSMYERSSPAYEMFMKWWLGEGADAYVNQLVQAVFWPYTGEELISRKESRRSELCRGVPFSEVSEKGFFDDSALKHLAYYSELQPYAAAVRKAMKIAAANIMSLYDWRKKPFSLADVKVEAARLIGESLFWDVVRQSFKDVDVENTWKRLLQMHTFSPHEMALWDKIAEPYVEKVKKAAAR